MNEYFAFGLLAFTSFFTLVNPMGSMPVFLTMTADLDQKHRDRTQLLRFSFLCIRESSCLTFLEYRLIVFE